MQIDDEIHQVSTDGAYDQGDCYELVKDRDAEAVIPPRKNAVIWQHDNCKAPPHPRDKNLRQIRKHGRKKWKKDSGHHRRSIAEMTMFRLKVTVGDRVSARKFDNQASELFIKCKVLNRNIQVAKPDSYVVIK